MTQVQPSSDSGAKVGPGVRKGVNHEWTKLDLDHIQDQGAQSSKSDSLVHSLLFEGFTAVSQTLAPKPSKEALMVKVSRDTTTRREKDTCLSPISPAP